MSQLQALLDEYGESHQNPKNKLVHYICVPIIAISTLAILWSIHFWVYVAVFVGAGIYYYRLAPYLATALLPVLLLSSLLFISHPYSLALALILFFAAWLAQFWGHKIEGKKPSFLKDLQFLLIGPLWITAHVFDILDLEKR